MRRLDCLQLLLWLHFSLGSLLRGTVLAVRLADDQQQQSKVGNTQYVKINHGNCRELGMFPVPDQSTCEEAAARLGLADRDAKETVEPDVPEGCYYYDNHDLMLSMNPHTQGHGAEMSTHHSPRHPICQTEPHNCQEDLPRFRTDWSWGKKQWCCGHYGLGCEAPEYRIGDSIQLLRRDGGWSNCVVSGVGIDGCVDVFVPDFGVERKVLPAMVAVMLRKPGGPQAASALQISSSLSGPAAPPAAPAR